MEGSDATKQADVQGDSGGQEKLVADNQQPISDADLGNPHKVTSQSAPPKPGALSESDE